MRSGESGSRRMTRRTLLIPAAGLAAALCLTAHLAADDAPPAPSQAPPPPLAPYPEATGGEAHPPPWLDEVRAQRRAWEERRQVAREQFDARRRATDPWGAAQKEAWNEEVERRREARRQRMEDERERFRDMGPPAPPNPWPDPPAGGDPALSGPGGHPGQAPYPPGAPPSAPFAPQDWDNPWYYRGY